VFRLTIKAAAATNTNALNPKLSVGSTGETHEFTAAFGRRVFGKRDRRAKGPKLDRALTKLA
jgi:hypothetical protein